MNTELYERLGVETDSDLAEIKKAYRERVLRAHPDRGGDQDGFHRLQEAYDILSDPDRRKRYDQHGERDPREALERLGDFAKHVCNPQHDDYILRPLRELEKLKREFEVNREIAEVRLRVTHADLKKLVESGRADDMEDVLTALAALVMALETSIERAIHSVRKCADLTRQYTTAKEILGRKDRSVGAGGWRDLRDAVESGRVTLP